MVESHQIFEYTGFITSYPVTVSGHYRLECWGAAGGGINKPRGAYSISFLDLKKGDNILILVGQAADIGTPDYQGCAGGGGGTFIAKGIGLNCSTPLCVAGGGGSQNHNSEVSNYAHGQATEKGGDLLGRPQIPGYGGNNGYGSGGGGFYGDGEIATDSNNGYPGISFVNGGSQVHATYCPSSYGGFGGGASSHGHCGGPAGGGGYSGGSSHSSHLYNGGGGGSFHMGTYSGQSGHSLAGYEFVPNPYDSNLIQGNNGNGVAKISLLSMSFNTQCFFVQNNSTILSYMINTYLLFFLISFH